MSGQTAIEFAEQLWNRDLSPYDPDGPLPEVDPLVGENTIGKGRASVQLNWDPPEVAKQWREIAAAKGLSMREVAVEMTARRNVIGTPECVATTIDEYVQADASDGFIVVPHMTPDGIGELADKVVPILQERGVVGTDYQCSTLRDHPRLATPEPRRQPWTVASAAT